jgi:hypothetical protein
MSVVAGPVLQYLKVEHPNENVTLRKLSTVTGLTQDQIKACMYNLLSRGNHPELEVVIPNNAWRWNDPTQLNNGVSVQNLHLVGTDRNGASVIEMPDGTLRRLI